MFRNIAIEEKLAEPELDPETTVTPDGRKEDQTPTKGSKSTKDKKQRKSSARSRGGGRRGSVTASPPPGMSTPASETEGRYDNSL